MRTQIRVLNRKVPHWAAMLSLMAGEKAVFKAAQLANIPQEDVTNPEARIDIRAEARFIESCADLSKNPLFAVEAALNGEYTPQVAAFVLKYSRNLREGLSAGAKMIPAVDPTSSVTLVEDAEQATLTIQSSDGFLATQVQHREFFAIGLVTMLRAVTDTNFMPIAVRFQHAKGPQDARDFQKRVGYRVEFGCLATEIILKPSTMDLPIPSCDETLLAFLMEQGKAILAQRSNDKVDAISQTEKLLVEALPQKWLDADEVAQALGLSRRTLSRRLVDLGENFRSVSEGLRKNLAENYLKDPSLSLAETAFLLCFSDQSGFTSAFKRWTGQTPGAFREANSRGG